jgi:hypothetical protein
LGVGSAACRARSAGGSAGAASAAAVLGLRGDACVVACLDAVKAADGTDVVGEAIAANAAGRGARPVAAGLCRPLSTVRGWLRRFAGKAEVLRVRFVQLLVVVAADPVVPEPAGSKVADAVAAIEAFACAVARRFLVLTVTPWQIASAA